MKLRRTNFLLVLIAAAALATAESDSAKVMMEAARKKEVVDGDLNGAIREYRAIVAEYKSDRAVAAMALVRMAECYQKMGDTESRKLYEQVVRDYSDQKDAVNLAKAKLGVSASAGVTTKLVLSSDAKSRFIFPASITPDGAFAAYLEAGDVYLRDLRSGTDRKLINHVPNSPDVAQAVRISRDGKRIFYRWVKGGPGSHPELRIADLAGDPNPRLLYDNPDVSWIFPYDWSPDGKSVAVQLARPDHSRQIGLITVPDGAFHLLKSIDWRGSNDMSFSPDGKYLAYDLPQTGAGETRDIYVLAVDGSREFPAVIHPSNDEVAAWSPDGKWLLFTSDRNGTTDLWAVAFAGGKTEGEPQRLKANLGRRFAALGITSAGSLYYRTFENGTRSKIQLATIDLANGSFISEPLDPAQDYLQSSGSPVWSSDGKELAYRIDLPARPSAIAIRSIENGKSREVRPELQYFSLAAWVPGGRFLLMNGTDFKGREGIFRMDVETGAVSPLAREGSGYNPIWAPDGRSFLVDGTGPRHDVKRIDAVSGKVTEILPVQPGQGNWGLYPAWSPDGTKIYYRRVFRASNGLPGATLDSALIERDLASGAERELIRRPSFVGVPKPTPDGRSLVTVIADPASNSRIVVLIPATGGRPRELLRVPSGITPAALNNPGLGQWPFINLISADSRTVVVRKRLNDRTDASEMWLVPIVEGQPKKIADMAGSGLAYSPDKTRVAYTWTESGPTTMEIWALENFLPKSTLASK
jgi:Tol biopolymer transport system component